jgi:hypothetical protein
MGLKLVLELKCSLEEYLRYFCKFILGPRSESSSVSPW